MSRIVQIESPTPVLNTPDFAFVFGGADGTSIPTNEKGHPLCFEFVALKGMTFDVAERCSEFIVRVLCPQYPSENLFLDQRFAAEARHAAIIPQIPSRDQILARMKELLRTPYVWGGNWSRGIPELLTLYPPKGSVDNKTQRLWTLAGVDCSGLLFETTGGATPRNTSQLVHFGKPVPIDNLTPRSLCSSLEPLDMIVYPGHVLFVLDSETTIESRSPHGVILSNLPERIDELLRERRGVDEWNPSLESKSQFVVRRFI